MSEFVQATLDAITLLKSKIEPMHPNNEKVGRNVLIDAVYHLEHDLSHYLTGK